MVIDSEALSRTDLLLRANGAKLADADGRLCELEGARGWLRRLAPEAWLEESPPGGHEAVVRSAWVTALVTLIDAANVSWLSDLQPLFAAESKLAQERACRSLGVDYPRTVVATRRSRIPDELGDRLVLKPLATGYYREASGQPRVVHATALDRDAPELDALGGAPFLVQEHVPAAAHLRIVTVRDQAWVCRLDAAELPVDWRAATIAHSSFEQVEMTETARRALTLAAALDVGYSSQDWIVKPDGSEVFLDLNPGGQWLFLPANVATAVTTAIVDWLTGEES